MKTAITFHALNGKNLLTESIMETATISNLIITEIVIKNQPNVIRTDISVEQSEEGTASERVIYVHGTRNGASAKLSLGSIDFTTGAVRLDDHVEYISGAVEYVTA